MLDNIFALTINNSIVIPKTTLTFIQETRAAPNIGKQNDKSTTNTHATNLLHNAKNNSLHRKRHIVNTREAINQSPTQCSMTSQGQKHKK